MDRRDFIKLSASVAALISSQGLQGANDFFEEEFFDEFDDATDADDINFIDAGRIGNPDPRHLKIQFKGTCSAGKMDWKNGEYHRHSCVLVEDSVMIDLTDNSLDIVPNDGSIKTICYTHSHSDHFDPEAAMKLGITKAYIHESWAKKARKMFAKKAEEMRSAGIKVKEPEIIPVCFKQRIVFNANTDSEVTLTPLLANHVTSIDEEFAVIYLIEKKVPARYIKGAAAPEPGQESSYDPNLVRVLYATDTGNITGKAARGAGIDSHRKPGKAINGLIMEATMGPDLPEDFRIFNHSSVQAVSITTNMLLATGRLIPGDNPPSLITHMSKSLYNPNTVAGINASLPKPLRAAYDDLTILYE